MAKRNMIETAKRIEKEYTKNKYLSAYDMDIDEICELMKMCKEDQYKAICTAFNYGLVLGVRAVNKKRIGCL